MSESKKYRNAFRGVAVISLLLVPVAGIFVAAIFFFAFGSPLYKKAKMKEREKD